MEYLGNKSLIKWDTNYHIKAKKWSFRCNPDAEDENCSDTCSKHYANESFQSIVAIRNKPHWSYEDVVDRTKEMFDRITAELGP